VEGGSAALESKEHEEAEAAEGDIGEPDPEVGETGGVVFPEFAEHDEGEVGDADDETEDEA